jgi:transposase
MQKGMGRKLHFFRLTITGIDFGVNNFVTMVNNAHQRPVIVKGNAIKSINQFYNKLRSRYYSKLKRVKLPGKAGEPQKYWL